MRKIGLFILILLSYYTVVGQVSVRGRVRSFSDLTLTIKDLNDQELYRNTVKSSVPFDTGVLPLAKGYYKFQLGKHIYLVWVDNTALSMKGLVDTDREERSTLELRGSSYLDSLSSALQEIKSAKKGWSLDSVKNKYSAIVQSGIVYLQEQYLKDKIEDLRSIYRDLLAVAPEANMTKWIAERVGRVDGFAVGASLKSIVATDAADKVFTTADYRGKLMLIDFWASWCVPCRVEIQKLKEIYADLKQENLVFVSVSIDSDKNKWLKAHAEEQLPWSSVWVDKLSTGVDVMADYGFQQIPFLLLVDQQGRIVERGIRGEQVREAILKWTKNE